MKPLSRRPSVMPDAGFVDEQACAALTRKLFPRYPMRLEFPGRCRGVDAAPDFDSGVSVGQHSVTELELEIR